MMGWLSDIADLMYWHMSDITAGLCLFLMFSPKLRIAAFISFMAALFAVGLEPMMKEFTVMQTKTDEIVPLSYSAPALIDIITAVAIVGGMKYADKADRFLSVVLESLIYILCAAAMVNVSVIVHFPQAVYNNYTDIFFVIMLLYLIMLFVGGARDAVGCIMDIYHHLHKRSGSHVVYNIFLYGRPSYFPKMAAAS